MPRSTSRAASAYARNGPVISGDADGPAGTSVPGSAGASGAASGSCRRRTPRRRGSAVAATWAARTQ